MDGEVVAGCELLEPAEAGGLWVANFSALDLQVQGWRVEKGSPPPSDCLELQELGWPQELACGGKRKNQPVDEWTSLAQTHSSGPHGPHSEMAVPLMVWCVLCTGAFMETKFL